MCHEKGIHVVVESCGYGDFEKFKMALPYIDAMFMDIKHIDTAVHKELTGAGNALILNNIKKNLGIRDSTYHQDAHCTWADG